MRFLFLLAVLLLPGCSSVGYLAETSLGQWRLFNRARPVDEVLASPRTTPGVRHGILLVKEAKAFAVGLGLKATRNYETFVALDAPCVSWAVSASQPLELKEKLWKFPIVGEVPYLGFFTKEAAQKHAAKLAASETPAPDVWVRCVPAFSSLGWFSDPLYSSMILGADYRVVETVVHESLHATVWVKGGVDFNEKLANFVGLEGSLRYVEREKGAAGVAEVREEVAGEKVFADYMQAAVDRYRGSVKTPDDKAAFYREFASRYDRFVEERRRAGAHFKTIRPPLETWNNAALLAYSHYYADYAVFEKMLARCAGDLGRFVAWIARAQDAGDPQFRAGPEAYLAKLAERETCPARDPQK